MQLGERETMTRNTVRHATVGALVVVLGGCATTDPNLQEELQATRQENADLKSSVASLQGSVTDRDAKIQQFEAELAKAGMKSDHDDELLPPNAKPGECYARVWVPATYRQVAENKLVKEASERIDITPAVYETVKERMLVKESSTRLETVPAVYGTESERIKVSDEELVWRIGPKRGDAPASTSLLAAARAGGANLDSATPGMCFHEHYRPAKYETVDKSVLVTMNR